MRVNGVSGESDSLEERPVVVEEPHFDDPAGPPLRCSGVKQID